MSDNARPCTHCGAPYIEPCDGKNPKCGNKPLADERKAAKDEGRARNLTNRIDEAVHE